MSSVGVHAHAARKPDHYGAQKGAHSETNSAKRNVSVRAPSTTIHAMAARRVSYATRAGARSGPAESRSRNGHVVRRTKRGQGPLPLFPGGSTLEREPGVSVWQVGDRFRPLTSTSLRTAPRIRRNPGAVHHRATYQHADAALVVDAVDRVSDGQHGHVEPGGNRRGPVAVPRRTRLRVAGPAAPHPV